MIYSPPGRLLFRAAIVRIISVSSIVGSIGNVGQCNYASAKAGPGGGGEVGLSSPAANKGLRGGFLFLP